MTTKVGDILLDKATDLWSKCKRCELHLTRTKIVHWRGSPKADIAIVGEAPGADEDEQGTPFVGKAGQALDDLLMEAGLDPSTDVFICNILACRPPNNREPLPDEISACKPRLQALLWLVKPKVILLAGGTAARVMAGVRSVGQWRGEQVATEILEWKGTWNTLPAVVTYHPSYWIRNGRNKELGLKMLKDITYAAKIGKA